MFKGNYKRIILIAICLIVIILCLVRFWSGNKLKEQGTKEQGTTEFEKILISNKWMRIDESGYGTITFKENGSFLSLCCPGCGNPVDDYDLYPYYEYDAKNNQIELYDLGHKNTRIIKVLDYSPFSLVLNIDGDIGTFVIEERNEENNYFNSKLLVDLFAYESNNGYSGYFNILDLEENYALYTIEGYKEDVYGSAKLKLSDKVVLEQLVITSCMPGIVPDDVKYDVDILHESIGLDEAKQLVSEQNYTAYVWYDEDAVVNKILFYKMIIPADDEILTEEEKNSFDDELKFPDGKVHAYIKEGSITEDSLVLIFCNKNKGRVVVDESYEIFRAINNKEILIDSSYNGSEPYSSGDIWWKYIKLNADIEFVQGETYIIKYGDEIELEFCFETIY